MSIVQLVGLAVFLPISAFLIWLVNLVLVAPLYDPLRHLPGPDASRFTSHIHQVCDPDLTPSVHKDWTASFGKTFRFHGFGKFDYRLISFDFRVITHVLNSPKYEKPWQARSLLSKFFGRGVFTAEGAEHAFQRKITGPAFTTTAVKELSPIFFQKAEELRDRWHQLIAEQRVEYGDAIPATVDAFDWFARATFDAFGLAAFDYHFHALNETSEALYNAFRKMFGVVDKKSVLHVLFPNLEKFWPDETTTTTRECRKVIHETGRELIANKKAIILGEKTNAHDIHEKDLLSLLIKSNLAADPCKRLSDEALLDQLSSFLFAGSDSTALSTTWCFHFLSLNPSIQTRLREEVMSALYDAEGNISPCTRLVQDRIVALPYLDAVVRETLRLCPPTHATLRVAMEDDHIPISYPVVLNTGQIIQRDGCVQIRKGSYVHIPIEGLNYDEDIWGKDAGSFNPDRWFSLPATARPPAFPGVANMMTFSLGPHSCPGFKFSITEIKAFVACLLPHFKFSQVEGQVVRKSNGILTRPRVKGKSGLPIVVDTIGH